MSRGNVVLGTLAGLAVGAIAGILFAPEKGSTIRKQIIGKKNGDGNKLRSKYDVFANSLGERLKSTKKDLVHLAEKGKEKYDDTKQEVKSAAEIFNQMSQHRKAMQHRKF